MSLRFPTMWLERAEHTRIHTGKNRMFINELYAWHASSGVIKYKVTARISKEHQEQELNNCPSILSFINIIIRFLFSFEKCKNSVQ